MKEGAIHAYTSLVDATADLKSRGYTSDFKIVEPEEETETCYSQSLDTKKTYAHNDLRIREYYRFEGSSNPDDMSIIYAIECAGGEKGTLIDAYGTYSSRRVAEFIKEIPMELDPAVTGSTKE